MKRIDSRNNPAVKHLHGLAHVTRERRKAGQTLLDGAHLVMAAYTAGWPLKAVYVSDSGVRHAEISAVLAMCGSNCEVICFSDSVFSHISPVTTPSGILALVDIPAQSDWVKKVGSLVILDGIQDPGNMGALLRTAAAAGVYDVVLTENCAHAWAPRVLRAGMGAHFLLALHEKQDIPALLDAYQGRVVATVPAADAVFLYELDLRGEIAWLFGGEGPGLSAALLERADWRMTIPMPGAIESLNVGAAAAICLFEQVRQQRLLPVE